MCCTDSSSATAGRSLFPEIGFGPRAVGGGLQLERIESGERLVEQQNPRPRRDRPRHLDDLSFAEIEAGHRAVRVLFQTHELEDLPSAPLRIRGAHAPRIRTVVKAYQHVL